jgi:hypothetical protein
MLLKTLRRAGIAILTLAIAGFVFAQDNAQSLEDALANATQTTIQEVTDNSNEFYGEFVTMDGEIGEFVNSYAFALGQSAAIDNDLVLVVNQSGEPFPPEIMTEARVTVTGRVHPSLIAVEEGAQTDFGGIFTGDTAVEDTIEAAGEEVAEEVDEEVDEELEEEQMEDSGMSEEEAEAQAEEGDDDMDDTTTEDTDTDNVPEGDADEAPAMAAEGGNVNMVQYVQEGNFPEGFENYTIIEIHSVDQVEYREDGQEEIGN